MFRKYLVSFGFVLGVCFCVLVYYFGSLRFGTGGFYNHGVVTLYASRLGSYDDYKVSSDHEWGHHVYQTMFEKGDLKLWLSIVDKCGYDGWNAKLYRSRGVKIEEEFADSFSLYIGDSSVLCSSKVAFIERFIN